MTQDLNFRKNCQDTPCDYVRRQNMNIRRILTKPIYKEMSFQPVKPKQYSLIPQHQLFDKHSYWYTISRQKINIRTDTSKT